MAELTGEFNKPIKYDTTKPNVAILNGVKYCLNCGEKIQYVQNHLVECFKSQIPDFDLYLHSDDINHQLIYNETKCFPRIIKHNKLFVLKRDGSVVDIYNADCVNPRTIYELERDKRFVKLNNKKVSVILNRNQIKMINDIKVIGDD